MLKKQMKDWMEAGVYAAVILVFLYFFCWPVMVDGRSMEPTLLDGDHVLVSRALAKMGQYDIGDLLVLYIEDEQGAEEIVKRLIGVSGDHIALSGGQLFRNGELLAEECQKGESGPDFDVLVPEGCLFVLGDNRPHSLDSRQLGAIPEEDIRGRVVFRFLPLSAWRRF